MKISSFRKQLFLSTKMLTLFHPKKAIADGVAVNVRFLMTIISEFSLSLPVKLFMANTVAIHI